MKGDRYEVLYQTVQILNGPSDFPHACKKLLQLLQRTLTPRSLILSLLDHRRTAFTRQITPDGPRRLQPCFWRPQSDSPAAAALRTGKPVQQGDLWHFPVCARRQKIGILQLQILPDRPLPDEWRDFFPSICEHLARRFVDERRQTRERQRLVQLTLLSELNSQLNQAGSPGDLLHAGMATIRKHTGAAGVVLANGSGTTPVNLRRAVPASAPWHEEFLPLERAAAERVAALGRPLFRRLRPRQAEAGWPAALVCIPLHGDKQLLGTLTVFGGGEKNRFFAAPEKTDLDFFAAVGSSFAQALERLHAREHLEILSRENDRKLKETTLLYHISRAIHSTLNLNELMHLILSVAVAPGGGGFERAMLFTVNERTETLQGILCVTRETAAMVVPQEKIDWERTVVTAEAQKAQREATCCQRVMKQRLSLTSRDNPLARCVRLGQAIFEPYPEDETAGVQELTEALQLGPFACAPLAGRNRALAVLLVDNTLSKEPLSPVRRRFFEMFASQAGTAMENSMLLHRLETAHQDLRETQARLIQGEKMATLGEMAASIAHELRNPLVPIGGFADRLGRMFPAGSREQQYAEIIIREVRRMEEMLANILVFSKKQMLCFGECHIAEIIEEALHLEAEGLVRGGIEVVREIAVDLPTVHCDNQKLRQVLINLITNARQAMPDGGTLTVRAARGKLRGEEALEVEVEDTGGGISGEVMRNLFNPFFTTKEKGTGLGLSISHRIIEHHRGEIEVKNRAHGVVFILRLPTRPVLSSQH